jgi:hypothetical protein
VAGTSGFKVGQKIIIGYGRTLEVATVTANGTPSTQARLAAAAPAGSTNLKVPSTANISAGDTTQVDIGQNTETVTVASVGTGGAHGTGLTLAAPLKFDHACCRCATSSAAFPSSFPHRARRTRTDSPRASSLQSAWTAQCPGPRADRLHSESVLVRIDKLD